MSQILKSIFCSFTKGNYTHALSKNAKHLTIDCQMCFYRWLFADVVKPPQCILCPLWPVRGINRTAWIVPDYRSPTNSTALCLCPNGCFTPPLTPHPPSTSTSPPPACSPPTDAIRDFTEIQKIISKTWSI